MEDDVLLLSMILWARAFRCLPKWSCLLARLQVQLTPRQKPSITLIQPVQILRATSTFRVYAKKQGNDHESKIIVFS